MTHRRLRSGKSFPAIPTIHVVFTRSGVDLRIKLGQPNRNKYGRAESCVIVKVTLLSLMVKFGHWLHRWAPG